MTSGGSTGGMGSGLTDAGSSGYDAGSSPSLQACITMAPEVQPPKPFQRAW